MMYYHIIKLGLALMQFSVIGSVSLRNARETPNPFDYQYVYGVKTRYSDCRWEYEREDGENYLGHNFKIDFWWIHLQDYKSEAYDINEQAINFLPTKTIKGIKLSAGAGYMLTEWRDGTPVVVGGVGNKYLKSCYKSNLNRRFGWDVVIKGKPIKLTDKIFVTPKLVYFRTTEAISWQVKCFMEVKLCQF